MEHTLKDEGGAAMGAYYGTMKSKVKGGSGEAE